MCVCVVSCRVVSCALYIVCNINMQCTPYSIGYVYEKPDSKLVYLQYYTDIPANVESGPSYSLPWVEAFYLKVHEYNVRCSSVYSVCVNVCVYSVCVNVCVYAVCVNVCVYAVCVNVCVYSVCVNVCVCVCVCVCVRVCVCIAIIE